MIRTPCTRRTLALLAVVGLAACENLHDPADTGVKVLPIPGEHEGPVDLVVSNRTGVDLICQVTEFDDCPGLDTDGLRTLEPAGRWEALEVTCAHLDVACTEAEVGFGDDPPLRVWSWGVVPPQEDDVLEEVDAR